jgi:hypothetical protein
VTLLVLFRLWLAACQLSGLWVWFSASAKRGCRTGLSVLLGAGRGVCMKRGKSEDSTKYNYHPQWRNLLCP